MSFAEPNMLNPQVYLERRFHYLPMFAYTSPDETAFVRWKLAAKLRKAGFQRHNGTRPLRLASPLHPRASHRAQVALNRNLAGVNPWSARVFRLAFPSDAQMPA